MLNRSVYIFPLLFLIFACAEKKKKAQEEVASIHYVPTLIQFNTCFTTAENDVSFPVWFNDSIVRANNILRITRAYILPDSEYDEGFVKMIKVYDFDRMGELEQLIVQEFYEGALINESRFMYESSKDEFGFARVKRLKSDIHYPDHFKIYSKAYFENYLLFQGLKNNDRRFYIPKKEFWKVLAVDTLLSPEEKDRIIYGTPQNPNREYSVRNKVEESNVIDYSYSNNDRVIRTLNIDKYPFITKRTFQFNKNYTCNGFIDSLFSGDHFLHAIDCDILYEKEVLPVTITHNFITSKGTRSSREKEVLKYEFYDQ